jgi:hypothetical protein
METSASSSLQYPMPLMTLSSGRFMAHESTQLLTRSWRNYCPPLVSIQLLLRAKKRSRLDAKLPRKLLQYERTTVSTTSKVGHRCHPFRGTISKLLVDCLCQIHRKRGTLGFFGGLGDVTRFRAPPPPKATTAEFEKYLVQVKAQGHRNSTVRKAYDTETAYFWRESSPMRVPRVDPSHDTS